MRDYVATGVWDGSNGVGVEFQQMQTNPYGNQTQTKYNRIQETAKKSKLAATGFRFQCVREHSTPPQVREANNCAQIAAGLGTIQVPHTTRAAQALDNIPAKTTCPIS